jgi:hypothetical protein
MSKKKKYFCRFCGKSFPTYYMAEICQMLDLKVNENKNNEPVNGSKKLRPVK